MRCLKIVVLTGKRGGFGAMRPMLRLFNTSSYFNLEIIATDQHLDKKFGKTINEIEKDFPRIHKIPLNQKADTSFEKNKSMSKLIIGLSKYFNEKKPDLLILYGDRSEILVAAMCATHHNILIGHIQGGDLTGNIDDSIRHAVTKLSHLHFVSCKDSYERVKIMGEEKWRIFLVGDNHIDPIIDKSFTKSREVRKKFNITKDLILFLFHPETLSPNKNYNIIKRFLLFLLSLDKQVVAIYPCSDNGYEKIIKILDSLKLKKNFTLFKNIDSHDFLGLMNVADILVGNSSAGIIEAPYFNLPSINIGERQRNRSGVKNVTNVGYDFENFKVNVRKILKKSGRRKFKKIYGCGDAGHKIFQAILKLKKAKKELLNKIYK